MNTPPLSRCDGAVLVGGFSRRMGRDKAQIRFKGLPLWQHQVNTLRGAGISRVGLVRRPGQPPLADDVAHWDDGATDIGPIAGLETALRESKSPFVAVLAVDLPMIDPGWFYWMWAHCGARIGAVAWSPPRYEPLAAIYPKSALPLVSDFIRGSETSLQQLIALLLDAGLVTSIGVPPALRNRLSNWNLPSDVPQNS